MSRPETTSDYLANAVEFAKISEDDRMIREERKRELIARSLDVVRAKGVPTPVTVQYRSSYTEGSSITLIPSFTRETPLVPYEIDPDTTIGVRMRTEVRGVSESDVAIDKIHITMHNLETGEQIGRKSAVYIGVLDDFVNNFAGDRAGIEDLDAALGIVEHIGVSLPDYQQVEQPKTAQAI